MGLSIFISQNNLIVNYNENEKLQKILASWLKKSMEFS